MSADKDGVDLLPCPNPWCEAGEREGDFRPQVLSGKPAMPSKKEVQ